MGTQWSTFGSKQDHYRTASGRYGQKMTARENKTTLKSGLRYLVMVTKVEKENLLASLQIMPKGKGVFLPLEEKCKAN